ncbi:MAG: BACON domain-containing protein, partial [Limisphaerales bacterium]
MKFLLTIFLIVASAFSLKASCLYYLGPAYLQASGSGGVYTINVISECAWSIKKHEWVDWLTFTSATSGVGNGAITFVVSSNNYAFARQTYFWLAENPGHTASISQAAGPNSCVSQLSHSEALFSGGYSTGQVSVAIQSNCSWTATSTVDWITINSPAEQSGSGLVNYSVARNDHDEARAAWIEIAGGWFYVFQSKCDFEVSQRLYSFPRS